MDVSINGSYEAYGNLIMLQVSLLYMQRPHLIRWMSLAREASTPGNGVINYYFLCARLLGTALSWASWMLAIFIGLRFGAISGFLFLVVGLGTSLLVMLIIPSVPRFDPIAHVISLPASIYFFRATLLSVGVDAWLQD